jgi:hypothetical protein
MGLETVTYISDIVATNPVGATDPKSQGDDHIRNIKAALLATFAAITGAVTATHTELNYLHGATGVTGTGNTVRSASPTFTGTPVVPDAWLTYAKINNAAAVSLLGRSANSSGVLADIAAGANDRILSRTSNALGFTQLTAGMFPSTVVPDAALSANVPLLNAANAFTADQSIAHSGATTLSIKASDANPGYVGFGYSGSLAAYVGVSGGAGNLINGSSAGDLCLRSDAASLRFGPSGGSVFTISTGGVLTTPNAVSTEVGFKGLPPVSGKDTSAPASSFTLALVHAGCAIALANGCAVTIPPNSSVAFPIGTVIKLYGYASGGGAYTVVRGSGVNLSWAGTNFVNADRNMGPDLAIAYLHKIDTNVWIIDGVNIS